MTSFCTKLHLGHSNRRCSKPMGPELIRASIMRDVQREQRGRSIIVSDGLEEKRACGMTLPCIWAGACSTLSHRWMPIRDGDATSMLFLVPEPWSILLTFQKN
jgi:hypothetical protein